jgi:hypothetical protein
VKVRHVGEGKVTANTIVFPEQCGRHGLCFVRTSNGQPQVTYGIQRLRAAGGSDRRRDERTSGREYGLGSGSELPAELAGGQHRRGVLWVLRPIHAELDARHGRHRADEWPDKHASQVAARE